MILSAENIFSDGQALTATAASTNIIDLGAPGTVLNGPKALTRDIGKGRPIEITVQLDVDSGGTSPTLDVNLEVATDVAFTSPKVVESAQQLAGGSAGARVGLYYILEGADLRYMRLNYTLGGTSPTYTVTAGVVGADQTNDTVAAA